MAERILNLPPMVSRLLLANLAVHGARLLLPDDLDWELLIRFGFVPLRYTVPELFGWPALVAPLTHQFLHGGLLHLAVNMAMLMAFGAGVERRIGGGRMLAFALLTGALAAAAHLAVYPDSPSPVVGASGAISGLFGGVLWLLARRRGAAGARTFLPLILLWIGISLLVGFTGLPGTGGAAIAWAAHIGGFLSGLLLFPLFDRRGYRPG